MFKLAIYLWLAALFLMPGLSLADWIDCGGDEDTSLVAYVISPIDTIKGITIFAIYPEEVDSLGSDTLLTYMPAFGDTAGYTPGQILKRSSFGNLIVTFDVNPALDGKLLVLPHSRNEYNEMADYCTTGYYPPNLQYMAEDVASMMDSMLDFGHYDADCDGYVDYLCVIYRSFSLDYGGQHWVGVPVINFLNDPGYYTTNDTNDSGMTVQIEGEDRCQTQCAAAGLLDYFDNIAFIWAHEFTHNLIPGTSMFSFLDNWYRHATGFHFTASAYSAQFTFPGGESWQRRCSYYQPYWAIKADWLAHENNILLEQPLYRDTLEDYISAGKVYEFRPNTYQRFIAANRQGLTENEAHWPSFGLFIWHIDEATYSQSPLEHKREDLEIADGLFVVNDEEDSLIAAPDSGYDEIDFIYKYGGNEDLLLLTGANFGDSGDAFIPPMDIVFDHTTNPNSNLYSFHNGRWYQDIPSHFSIRNLQADPSDSTKLIMDVLANHWYDSLTASTVWGDSTKETGYAITGDFKVPAGDTLKILKGTRIYFQADHDDLAGGASGSKCELIVYGTLIAEGTSSDSIYFIPSSEQLGTAEAGDWYGIRIMAGSEGNSLKYCAIRDAYNGIFMNDSSEVSIDHSRLEDISSSGIYNDQAKLSAVSCVFENIGNIGVSSNRAESEIIDCDFKLCEDYGIYAYYEATSPLDSTLITDCLIQTNSGSYLSGSQYGIRADGIDKIRIENNFIKTYEQGGIYFNASSGLAKGDTIQLNGYYGIYSNNSGGLIDGCVFDLLPKGIYCANGATNMIRHCEFDSVGTGVRAQGASLPDCGDTLQTGYGDNNFTNCGYWYIWHDVSPYADTLKAEMNYFGGTPNANKFYGLIDYTPYRRDRYQGKAADQEPALSFLTELSGNYPNPFNPATNIAFNLAAPGLTTITIYNVLGQVIARPVQEFQQAGSHLLVWDGRNRYGEPVASGIYFYRIESGEFVDSKKMTVIR